MPILADFITPKLNEARLRSSELRRSEGGTFWTESELFLTKIRTATFNCRPVGGNPAQRLAAWRRAEPAKIETFFRERAQKIFSIKETIFAGFASLLTQGRAASRPSPPSAGRADGRKFLPPNPLPFRPSAWASPDFSVAGKFFKKGGW